MNVIAIAGLFRLDLAWDANSQLVEIKILARHFDIFATFSSSVYTMNFVFMVTAYWASLLSCLAI